VRRFHLKIESSFRIALFRNIFRHIHAGLGLVGKLASARLTFGAVPKGFGYDNAMQRHSIYWLFVNWLMGINT